MKSPTRLASVLELALAAGFWGFGFIATVWSLKTLSAMEITAMRFGIAMLVGLPFLFTLQVRQIWRRDFAWAFLPAILLTGTLIFQTYGLQYTTATKSGFITTLYVVFIPVLESLLKRKRLPWSLWGCVIVALLGTALIVNLGFTDLNLGDVLTLICAVFAALQIYYIGMISPRIKTPFAFNIMQSIWCFAFAFPFVINTDFASKLADIPNWPFLTLIGMLSLSIGSTVLAFFLQVRAQARLSPTVSSLLCLLESPFSLIFAFCLLNENLGASEAFGAVLIFAAAVGASVLEVKK